MAAGDLIQAGAPPRPGMVRMRRKADGAVGWRTPGAAPDDFIPDRPPGRTPTLRQQLTAPVNWALSAAHGAVQPLANEMAKSLTFESGPQRLGSMPTSTVGRAAATMLNPMPADIQDAGMLGASMAAGPLARPLSKGLGMVARPIITGLGSLAGGMIQGATDYTKPLIGAAIGGALEVPGFLASALAPRLGRQADNAAAAAYASRASGMSVPATREGLAAARQREGAGSLAEPIWAEFRKKFDDAIALAQDRPVAVTTSKPGEAPIIEMLPLSQAKEKLWNLPEWFQKRKMMAEITDSLRTPIDAAPASAATGWQRRGAVPASPEAAALLESSGDPVRRTMSAIDLLEGKGLNPVTGDANIMAMQARHQEQMQKLTGGDIPKSLHADARDLLRRGDPTARIDQPPHMPGGIREGHGTAGARFFFSPAELLSGRLPVRVGETPLNLSGLTPALLGPSYGDRRPPQLGAMPAPQPPPPTNPETMTLSAPGPHAAPQDDVLAVLQQLERERAQRDMLGQDLPQ